MYIILNQNHIANKRVFTKYDDAVSVANDYISSGEDRWAKIHRISVDEKSGTPAMEHVSTHINSDYTNI